MTVATIIASALAVSGLLGQAEPVRDIASGQDALILEERLEIEIRSTTDARLAYYKRTKVLSPQGVEMFDLESVFYGPGDSVRKLEGTVVLPTGRRLRAGKRDTVDGPAFASFELYADTRHRSLRLPGAVPGAVIEYSYEKTVRNLHRLENFFLLQEMIPARLKTLSVTVPLGIPMGFVIKGSEPRYTREETGNSVKHVWEVRDVPALKMETAGPPMMDLFPRIDILPRLIDWGERRISATSWKGVADFYHQLAASRMEPTPEVSSAAARLVAGAGDDEEKIRRIFDFVKDEIDYVAISLGIGGWQPHSSGAVLRHRYGDCKDKTTLMVAMLKAVGLKGYPVLVRTRDMGLLDDQEPSLSFNHAIVGVAAGDGLRFLDPTATTTAFDDLPWQDQGVPTLPIRPDGSGGILWTPLSAPAKNKRTIHLEAELMESGDLRGKVQVEARGQRMSEVAYKMKRKPEEQRKAVVGLLSSILPGARVESHAVEFPDATDVMRVTAEISAPGYVTRVGALGIASAHPIRIGSLAGITASTERTQAVFFPYLHEELVEIRLLLPAGRTLKSVPENLEAAGAGVSARTQYSLQDVDGREAFVVRRTMRVDRREIPASNYDALRELILAMSTDEATGITLRAAR